MMPNHRETITALNAPAAVGPYVHAVRTAPGTGLLFCSGQIPLDPESGELVGETPAEQAEQCLANLTAVCAAAGARLADAVRITVYLTDMGAFAEVGEVYAKAFAEAEPPARVAIGVAALPKGAQVEMDAVVALPA
jgi:2-iminobutanoate/2-iminopropanoate deaminase